MAVAAINPKSAHVVFVAKWNGLFISHVLPADVRGSINKEKQGDQRKDAAYGAHDGQLGDGVTTRTKELCHSLCRSNDVLTERRRGELLASLLRLLQIVVALCVPVVVLQSVFK